MRIIETLMEEKTVTCTACKSVIGYNEEDEKYTSPFGKNICCPQCGNDILIEEFDKCLKFPDAFYFFDGIKFSDEEIRKYCIDGLIYLSENPDEEWWSFAAGNLKIQINKYKEEEDSCVDYEISVSKSYWSADVFGYDLPKIIGE